MAWQFTTNVLIPGSSDKLGKIWITVKNALVATGRWRVRGSGDGYSQVQLQGQTAGLGGSFDVFTKSQPWSLVGPGYPNGGVNSISNYLAWFLLEEIASGRMILIQRNNQSSGENFSFVVGLGAATSGATATVAPALTTSRTILNSAGMALSPQLNWQTTQEQWLQIAAEDGVRTGNVSPWFIAIWNRTLNAACGGAVWASLVDLDPAVTNNVATACGFWADVFGNPGSANGALHVNTLWRGGNAWDATSFTCPQNSGVGVSPPTYQQVGTDNKWRTHRPWVLQPPVGSRYVGRLEDFYLNKLAREYPSTYGIAGAEPRLTLGHLIVPWTATTPQSSP